MFGWGHICIYDLTYMRNHKYHLQFLQTSGFLIRGSARTWAHSQSSSASPPRTQLPSISGAETETANPTSYQSESFVRQTRQTRIFGSCWRVSWSLFHSRAGKYELTQISGKPSFYNVQMKIRISNVSEDDFGLWRCLAKNSQGETSGEIKLYGMSMYDTSNYEAIAPAPLDHLQFTLEERKRMLEQHYCKHFINRLRCITFPSPPNTHPENPRSATTTITPPISHFDPQHEMPLGRLNILKVLL